MLSPTELVCAGHTAPSNNEAGQVAEVKLPPHQILQPTPQYSSGQCSSVDLGLMPTTAFYAEHHSLAISNLWWYWNQVAVMS